MKSSPSQNKCEAYAVIRYLFVAGRLPYNTVEGVFSDFASAENLYKKLYKDGAIIRICKVQEDNYKILNWRQEHG